MILNDAREIVSNLEDFVELPRGIERLRKTVLSLAVSGKLLNQKSDDGTGEELFNEIQRNRSLQPSGKKRKNTISPINQVEIPFEVPSTWKWVRMGEICYIEMGQSPEGKDVIDQSVGLPFFQGKSEFGYTYPTPRKWCLKPKKTSEAGDILLSVRAPVGSTNFASEKCGIGRGLAAIRPELDMPNVFWRIVLDYFTYVLLQKATGTTFQAIKGGDLSSLVVPLPPLAEQRRIVEKVEQVMNEIDSLEAKKIEREEIRKRLTKNAMHSLGLGNAHIALKNLEELVKTSSDLKELEKGILTLAFSGKLVSQLATDGNAADLFDEIKQKQYIGQVKKKRAVLSPITDEECPFDIPKTWKWIRLGECISISSGDLLRVSDANHGEYLVYGGNGIAGRHTAFNAKKGTIVIGRVGALCGVAHITETDAWVTDNAFIVNYPEGFLDKNFFKLLLNHLNLRQAHRGSAQPVISGISVYPMLMPLPPLQEQKRIAEKVEKVMELIRPLRLLLSKD